jgi:hypothetical protein
LLGDKMLRMRGEAERTGAEINDAEGNASSPPPSIRGAVRDPVA